MPGPARGVLREEPSASIAHARVCEGRGRRRYGNPYSGTKPETVDTCQGDAYGCARLLLLGAVVRRQHGPVAYGSRVPNLGAGAGREVRRAWTPPSKYRDTGPPKSVWLQARQIGAGAVDASIIEIRDIQRLGKTLTLIA
jgi:hypothetical protein